MFKYDDTLIRREFRILLDERDEHFKRCIIDQANFTTDVTNGIKREISNIYEQLRKLMEKEEKNFKNGKYFYEIKLPEEKFFIQFETKDTFIEYFAREVYKKKAFKANKKAWRAINDYIQNFKSKK